MDHALRIEPVSLLVVQVVLHSPLLELEAHLKAMLLEAPKCAFATSLHEPCPAVETVSSDPATYSAGVGNWLRFHLFLELDVRSDARSAPLACEFGIAPGVSQSQAMAALIRLSFQ